MFTQETESFRVWPNNIKLHNPFEISWNKNNQWNFPTWVILDDIQAKENITLSPRNVLEKFHTERLIVTLTPGQDKLRRILFFSSLLNCVLSTQFVTQPIQKKSSHLSLNWHVYLILLYCFLRLKLNQLKHGFIRMSDIWHLNDIIA